MVVGEGVRLTAAGIVLGMGLAWGLGRLLAALLVDVEPFDPATSAGVAALFLAAAAAASFLPANRAAAVPPQESLRE
jgi:predicted lysophospholipase L1 biosynthesis ABC-type transport system permease subunit